MTDSVPDPPQLDGLLRELADQLADRLGPERDSEITAHLARLADRSAHDPQLAVAEAHAALQAAPGPPEEVGRRRGSLAEAVEQLSREVAAQRQALTAALGALADSARPGTHRHPELEGELDALHDRFTEADRHRAWTPTDLDLSQRLGHLEAQQRTSEFRPWFSSQRFSEAFRGDPAALDDRYADLADLLAATGGPVLDLGCGAGDLLRLLGRRDVMARGIDADPELVAEARAHGLTVEQGDALEALSAVEAASLGAIAVIQVVEHLPAQRLVELVALAADKLRPGGLLVAETINPASLYVYGHALYLDPTHTTPIHPLYLQFLCQEAGFGRVEVQHRSHPPDDERLPTVMGGDEQLVEDVDRTIARLNELLFGAQDYAVLATR